MEKSSELNGREIERVSEQMGELNNKRNRVSERVS